MMSLSDDEQPVVNAFNNTSVCLDGVLDASYVYFDRVVGQMCPSGLRLGEADTSDTEVTFLDLH